MGESLQGKTAVVTGASSGLGCDFARELAAEGAALVLVARRADALATLAAELKARFGTTAHVYPADLASPEARIELCAQLQRDGLHVDVLINNAGFGVFGDFLETDWARTAQMLELDITALTHLTRLLAPGMVDRGFGRILLVSSIGAFQPSPTYAAYSAAKSYVLSFGVALNYELRKTGVTCTTVCPGVIATEFPTVSGQRPTWYHRLTMMTSADVARRGVHAALRGRSSTVTGLVNAFMAWSTRFMPRDLSAAVTYQVMKN